MHSDILNYTKLAFNSLKTIQNDTVYQPIKQGAIGLEINGASRNSPVSKKHPQSTTTRVFTFTVVALLSVVNV